MNSISGLKKSTVWVIALIVSWCFFLVAFLGKQYEVSLKTTMVKRLITENEHLKQKVVKLVKEQYKLRHNK